jgi:hypothetical protein
VFIEANLINADTVADIHVKMGAEGVLVHNAANLGDVADWVVLN